MSLPKQDVTHESVIASLHVQALREGESLWFRVASGSMSPTLSVGDSVRIEPARARDIRIGEVAAFVTAQGLVVHRIVQRERIGAGIRLLEMGDVDLRASWVEEPAVVGRVVVVHHGTRQIDLQRPVAKKWGTVTAHLRYRLYLIHTNKKSALLQVAVRRCSRLVVRIGYWCRYIPVKQCS